MAEDGLDLAVGRLVDLLMERRVTLATAESLTGGMVGAVLTDVPGVSAVYRGGVIVYATDLKAKLAGVPDDLLAAVGPVHADTAAALATGSRSTPTVTSPSTRTSETMSSWRRASPSPTTCTRVSARQPRSWRARPSERALSWVSM